MVFLTPSNGSQLSTAATTEGKTYLLSPGAYYISSTLQINKNKATCFNGSSRGGVTIFVNTGSSDSTTGRGFIVSSDAQLGLHSLVLDGQGKSPGVRLAPATSLHATDVTFQNFKLQSASFACGGAVLALSASVLMTGVDFLYNSVYKISQFARAFGGALCFVNNIGINAERRIPSGMQPHIV
jgi:hypothetical protein